MGAVRWIGPHRAGFGGRKARGVAGRAWKKNAVVLVPDWREGPLGVWRKVWVSALEFAQVQLSGILCIVVCALAALCGYRECEAVPC